MRTLFIAFFVGACCCLSACKGGNNLEKHKEAVAVFQLELADFGATSEALVYKNLGASYLEQGKVDEAVVAFKKAVQIAPRFIEAHYLLADVYSIKGEGVLSRKSLDQAMALEGSYIIDIGSGIMDQTHTIIESTPPAVIRSEGVIELPPEFFEDPGKIGVPRKWESRPK